MEMLCADCGPDLEVAAPYLFAGFSVCRMHLQERQDAETERRHGLDAVSTNWPS